MVDRFIIVAPLEFDRFIIIPSLGSRETLPLGVGLCICLRKTSASGILFAGVAVGRGAAEFTAAFEVDAGTGLFVGAASAAFPLGDGRTLAAAVGAGTASTLAVEFTV